MIVKMEWTKRQNTPSPYFVEVPANLKSVWFIEKGFPETPDTSGWGKRPVFV